MSLPHWIKWNKVKGKYEINNNMKCFEQQLITKLWNSIDYDMKLDILEDSKFNESQKEELLKSKSLDFLMFYDKEYLIKKIQKYKRNYETKRTNEN